MEKNTREFTKNDFGGNIDVNRETLEFYEGETTEEVLFTWNSERITNLRLERIEGVYGYDTEYEFMDDGVLGKCLIRVKGEELNVMPEEDTKTMQVFFTSDDYDEMTGEKNRAIFKLYLHRRSFAKVKQYINLERQTVFFTPALESTYINYSSESFSTSGEKFKIVRVDSDNSFVNASFDDRKINILCNGVDALEMFGEDKYAYNTITVQSERTNESGVVETDYQQIFCLIQLPNIVPVWKDSILRYSSPMMYEDYEIYRCVVASGSYDYFEMEKSPIYTGRIFKTPNDEYMYFRMNNICRNFLKNNMELFGEEERYRTRNKCTENKEYCVGFYIKVQGKYIGGYHFINDWSYKNKNYVHNINYYVGETLTRKIPFNADFVASVFVCRNGKSEITLASGRDKFSGDWIPICRRNGIGGYGEYNVIVDLAQFRGADNICQFDKVRTSMGGEFDIVQDCCNWMIYYKNSAGGYSFLNVNGNVNISDETTSHDIMKNFNNNYPQFEQGRYMNEVIKKYNVNFNFLNKETANNIDEITESTEIWLEDCSDRFNKKIYPVLCKTTATDFKQNIRVRNYTLEFVGSQSRIRK